MQRPKLCLCLLANTLEDDLALVRRYRKYIDMVELRADYLNAEERISIKRFPSMCDLPCILTIRRKNDGGVWQEGEGIRATTMARAIGQQDVEGLKSFDFIDFEDDFRVAGLQDAALAYNIKIIRSYHNIKGNVPDIKAKFNELSSMPYELPKLAFMPRSLSDITALFRTMQQVKPEERIICAMGSYATPARVLISRLGSSIAYCMPPETLKGSEFLGQIDPVTMQEEYRFSNITSSTRLFGITGFPLNATSSPKLHNLGYKTHNIDAVYLPLKSQTIEETLDFANVVGLSGLSITVPHKEAIVPLLNGSSNQVSQIGACNTAVFSGGKITGFNTDTDGFKKAILEMIGGEKAIKHCKVSLIGAGGAAKAVAYVLQELKAKVCVFNRTIIKARILAESYNFKYAFLGPESSKILNDYSDIIVQTTSCGMGSTESSNQDNDPLWFYDFTGHEKVMDIIYTPDITPLMARAHSQGCIVQNGYKMLLYQAQRQFEIFTGIQADSAFPAVIA